MAFIWLSLLIIFASGAIGGLVNAFTSDNGFVFPRLDKSDTSAILRPGFVGNALIGGLAAVVSFGLYGPFGDTPLIVNRVIHKSDAAAPSADVKTALAAPTATEPLAKPAQPSANDALLLSAVMGAILVGVGGARVLTSEVDKRLLKAAVAQAAGAASTPDAASKIISASPAKTLQIATELPR